MHISVSVVGGGRVCCVVYVYADAGHRQRLAATVTGDRRRTTTDLPAERRPPGDDRPCDRRLADVLLRAADQQRRGSRNRSYISERQTDTECFCYRPRPVPAISHLLCTLDCSLDRNIKVDVRVVSFCFEREKHFIRNSCRLENFHPLII